MTESARIPSCTTVSLGKQGVVYEPEVQAFRSQRTHVHQLVAERAPEPKRNGATPTAQAYQHQSRTASEPLVWAA